MTATHQLTPESYHSRDACRKTGTPTGKAWWSWRLIVAYVASAPRANSPLSHLRDLGRRASLFRVSRSLATGF